MTAPQHLQETVADTIKRSRTLYVYTAIGLSVELLSFFATDLADPSVTVASAWFSFEGVPLKWHYPLGLLFDLFSGASPVSAQAAHRGGAADAKPKEDCLPWCITLHFSDYPDEQLVQLDPDGKVIHDSFINSIKEADFLRNGTGDAIMKLSKDESVRLWESVKNYDQRAFFAVHNRLLPSSSELRHIPLRVYLPSNAKVVPETSPQQQSSASGSPQPDPGTKPSATSHLRVIQPHVAATQPQTKRPQTLGSALQAALPSLFPSKSTPILANPVLHGVVVSLKAPLEEVMRAAAYMDGWLHVTVDIHG